MIAQCTDCECEGGTCTFNVTAGRCQCQCQDFTFGDACSYGKNETTAHIESGAVPTRKANITLEIYIPYQDAYNNLSSLESIKFINMLEKEIDAMCKQADPQAYKTVQVIKLSNGSVVAESVVQYNYQNNETQISFLNNELDRVLTDILNHSNNLQKISQAFCTDNVLLSRIAFQPPLITNITDLKPYINCSPFANYTAVIIKGQWQCVSPCTTNPNYCNQHGDCLNDIKKGPTCKCYQTSLGQFYGPQCEQSMPLSTTNGINTTISTDHYKPTFLSLNTEDSPSPSAFSEPRNIYSNVLLTLKSPIYDTRNIKWTYAFFTWSGNILSNNIINYWDTGYGCHPSEIHSNSTIYTNKITAHDN
ncbi:mucin-3B-like [Melanotaenia boesemani]|uniref:mucin-3B-like n=1 Tax=Melanotaenia boesemani TaxID=1250792 RepID=UPI001C042A8D|nr:mucin-3B-like [Melanotaenia boesemani]